MQVQEATSALRSPWAAYLAVVGLVCPVVYLLVPEHWGYAVNPVVIVAATVGMTYGVRRARLDDRRPWVLLTLGLATWVPASGFEAVYEFTDLAAPTVSPAELFYLAQYPLQAAGLLFLLRACGSGRDRAGVIDSLVMVLAAALPSWVFFIGPSLSDTSMSGAEHILAVAYPLGDLVLFAMLVRLLLERRSRQVTAFWMVVAGIVVLLVSDVTWSALLLETGLDASRPLTAVWMVYLALLSGAALHPSVQLVDRVTELARPVLSPARLTFLTAAALAGPTLLLLAPSGREPVVLVALVTIVMFVLVVLRLHGLMVDVERYRRMERVKDEFVAVVSHELRTPLTSIHGSLALLAGGAAGELPPRAGRMLDIAASNTDRLVRLVNDILDVARIESGGLVLDRQACPVASVVRQALEETRTLARTADVVVEAAVGDATAWADPDRVVQVLVNLVGNAVKFSPAGGTVRVSVTAAGDDVLLTVSDEGRGIPPHLLGSIFDRFQQADSSDAREKGGTGLGLAICRSIVDEHGGRIWVRNNSGPGCTFSFTLPRGGAADPAGPDGTGRPGTVPVPADPRLASPR